jgi:hypothetical protein
MNIDRPKVEANYKEIQPGVYDQRDWNEIQAWAEKLAKLSSSGKSTTSPSANS